MSNKHVRIEGITKMLSPDDYRLEAVLATAARGLRRQFSGVVNQRLDTNGTNHEVQHIVDIGFSRVSLNYWLKRPPLGGYRSIHVDVHESALGMPSAEVQFMVGNQDGVTSRITEVISTREALLLSGALVGYTHQRLSGQHNGLVRVPGEHDCVLPLLAASQASPLVTDISQIAAIASHEQVCHELKRAVYAEMMGVFGVALK